ncbi:hypothetical protein V501_06699 [Pseudogymnoascus sp. VKM F-4519 (FW-2642)]|nr:hypothetical protein V501_06699 [Pseudogymnoascus sp. VKM F-4519 (FW-2642)]
MATQLPDHFTAVSHMEQSEPLERQHPSESPVSPKGFTLPGGAPAYVNQPSSKNVPSSQNYTNDLPSPPSTIKTSPSALSPHYYQKGRLVSPPISRSTSLNGKGVEQVDDWREFTRRQREQFLGEKAHMEADRARAEEVMAEERSLWDKERALYEERIAELEAQLAAFTGPSQKSPATSALPPPVDAAQKAYVQQSPSITSDGATSRGSNLGSPLSRSVTQESGRNPDGSPFYAPAPQHPSRTFEGTSTIDQRVDDMFTLRETGIRVTSKELSESDFQKSPDSGEQFSPREDTVIGDSIDISLIQPELEGVPIKSSAVAPMFAAQIRSPSGTIMSPNKFSPDTAPPPRPSQSYDRHSPMLGPRKARDIIKQPEGRRLTMHAGHTPNHSVIHFDLGDSGVTTPKSTARGPESIPTVVEQDESPIEDPELSGPLGLTNDAPEDKQFLAALTSKLEEVAESERTEELDEQELSDGQVLQNALRAIGRVNGSRRDDDEDGEGLVAIASTDDIPMLKLKQTPNFGRPLGSL